MDEKLKEAYISFYSHDYKKAKDIFKNADLPYEAGLSAFMLRDLKFAEKCFRQKENICPASNFGLIILDIIEDRIPKQPKYFQTRCFLEVYLNLLIENNLLSWAQKIIDNYELFCKTNLETPKFIARVLYANNYYKAVHSFANLAKSLCFYDAEIHYIDAVVYMDEKDYKKAKECIKDCISFAPDYYPIARLNEELINLTK